MIEQYVRTDKIFRHPDRVASYLNGGDRYVKPVTVELHLTNKCNIKCGYCMYKDKHDKVSLSEEDASRIIRRLSYQGVKGLTFSGGGEPTVHPSFPIIAWEASCLMDVALITNGVKYTNPLEAKFEWIRFSVDARDAKTYKQIKGVNKFNTVIESIRLTVECKKRCKLGTTIGFQMVITENNYWDIYETAKFADSLGVDYFQCRPVERGDYTPEQEVEIDKQIDLLKTGVEQGVFNCAIVTSAHKWSERKLHKGYTNCPGADFIGAVGADGEFYICCHHVQDPTASYGKVLDEYTWSIFNAQRKDVQAKFDYSKCPVACRGATINERLNTFNNVEHINFL